MLYLLPLPKYLSLHQHISNTSQPLSCLYIRYPCLLCFPLLPFLLDLTFALSVRFLSFLQYIFMTSVPNVIPIHPFSLPALLPDIASADFMSLHPLPLSALLPTVAFPSWWLLPLLSLSNSSLSNSISPWLLCRTINCGWLSRQRWGRWTKIRRVRKEKLWQRKDWKSIKLCHGSHPKEKARLKRRFT